MKRLFQLALFVLPALAQQEQVGPVRGEEKGDYNVVQSWELGYRFSEVGGNKGVYRADVNYGNGIRLLGSSLTINSKDGKGHFFDEIILTTQGLGNDPYESAVLRAQKNRIYVYDLSWRSNDYFNPGLVTSNGLHLDNTQNRWQDHDLTIFPQSKYRLRLGYSRTKEDGPALSSQQFFGATSDALPLFTNVRREFNEYRLGGDVEFWKIKLTVLRRWEFYKEDTPYVVSVPETSGGTTLSQFRKSEPLHGSTPGWLVNLFTERHRFTANGRFTYAGGRQNFIVDEHAVGLERLFNQNRQVFVSGTARRPVTTADGSLSLFLTSKLTLVNTSSFANTRIDGNNFFQQFDASTFTSSTLNFQFLGIRLFTNSTDLRYQIAPSIGIYAGYNYADRRIRSNESTADPGSAFSGVVAEQSNHQHAGIAGVNWTIFKPLRLHLEGEVGRNDNPFYPVSERNYHAINARLQYRLKKLQLSTSYKQNYNNNSISLTAYSSHARNFSASGSWTARPWASFDASYSHLHLDTLGGLAFFAGSPRPTSFQGLQSVYVSNIHAATLGVRFSVLKRADLFVGYSITRDVGDGRPTTLFGAITGAPPSTPVLVNGLLASVQTFPLTFQSPIARVSVRLHQNLRFNVGYQYYGYKEDLGLFGINQNYRANTGYTSLMWAF